MQFRTGKIEKLAGRGSLSDRQIRVVASTSTPDRVGDIMEPAGCDLGAYKENPIVLADHDSSKPIGTAFVSILPGRVEALITFAPAGVSAKADEYCSLAKVGILKTVSVGFNPIERKPTPQGGYRYTKWELMELSVVAVPCNPEALVIERSFGSKAGRVLSHANEGAIRQASNHLDKAAGHLRNVLDQAGGSEEDDNEDSGDDHELSARVGRQKLSSRRRRLAEIERLVRIGEAHQLAVTPDERAREKRMREADILALSLCP